MNNLLHNIYLYYSDNITAVNDTKKRHRISLSDIDNLVTTFRAKEGIRTYTQAEKRNIVPCLEFFDRVAYQQITSSMSEDEQNEQMKCWSGLLMIDFDLNHYQGAYRADFVDKAKQIQHNIITQMYNTKHINNFAFSQLSLSNVSMHFVFYFNTERTIKEYNRCYAYAFDCVYNSAEKVFGKLWGEVADDASIWDKCSKTPAQRMCISANEVVWNDTYIVNTNAFGSMDEVEIWAKQTRYTENAQTTSTTSNIKAIQHIINVSDTKYNKFDANIIPTFYHDHVWQMGGVMLLALNDKHKCVELFKHVAKDIAEQYYRPISEHEIITKYLGGLRPFVITEGTHKEVLTFVTSTFNINIKLRPTFADYEHTEGRKYDEVIKLNEGETISDYFSNIVNSEHNLIYAEGGCGYGKTYSAISYSHSQTTNDITTTLFGEIVNRKLNKRICFVTPMQSINKDSFAHVKGWCIVDGAHNNKLYVDDLSLNIVTTWDTFSALKMYERKDFDIFIIDETHLLFLTDYRFKACKGMLRALNYLHNNNRKTIMYSGTPTTDFTLYDDMYKIKFDKDIKRINANVIAYENEILQHVASDVKLWINASDNNKALIMCDNASASMRQKLSKLDVHVTTMYHKAHTEDVQKVQDTKHIEGNVCLMSAFASVGVNIYPHAHDSYKIFIVNENACSIIQYANRLRDRNCIDSINVYINRAYIVNGIRDRSVFALDRAKMNALCYAYNIGHWSHDDIISVKDKFPFLHVVDGVWAINEEEYNIYDIIEQTTAYERQTQIIVDRLRDNNYIVNFEYRDEIAVKKIKTIKHYSDCVEALAWSDFPFNANSKRYYIADNMNIAKYCTNKERDVLEYIRNEVDEVVWKRFKEETHLRKMKVNKEYHGVGKVDVNRFAEAIKNVKKLTFAYDSDLFRAVAEKLGEVEKISVNDKIHSASVICALKSVERKDYERVYVDVNEVCLMCGHCRWYIEGMIKDMCAVYDERLINDIGSMNEQQAEIYYRAHKELSKLHDSKLKCKMIVVYKNDMMFCTCEGYDECCKRLGVNIKYIQRHIKDHTTTKEGYRFEIFER